MLVGVDPARLVLFVPPGVADFKRPLFERLGEVIRLAGGMVVRGDHMALLDVPADMIPMVRFVPQLRLLFEQWTIAKREFIFWDRGYFRRAFGSWQCGLNGGYWRVHRNTYQAQCVREGLSDDRWQALNLTRHVKPWNAGGRHIVVADTGSDYWDCFADRMWVERTVALIRQHTDRKVVVRSKSSSLLLEHELRGAHALVTHGSNAAVEAVALGCPVFVDKVSAAALMGRTDFTAIEQPVRPHRWAWFRTLSYSQYNERELVDGTMFRLVW